MWTRSKCLTRVCIPTQVFFSSQLKSSSQAYIFSHMRAHTYTHMASGDLEVLLVGCKEIREKDLMMKMNPYVVVRYGNQELKSNVARGEEKKVWDEKLNFKAEYPGGEDHKYKLTFHIMDKHDEPEAEDEFVGESVIYVKEVVSIGVEKGEKELPQGKYRVVLSDKTYAGEISVAVKFKLTSK